MVDVREVLERTRQSLDNRRIEEQFIDVTISPQGMDDRRGRKKAVGELFDALETLLDFVEGDLLDALIDTDAGGGIPRVIGAMAKASDAVDRLKRQV